MKEEAVPEDGAAMFIDGKLAGRVTSARYSPANGNGRRSGLGRGKWRKLKVRKSSPRQRRPARARDRVGSRSTIRRASG